MHWNEYQVTILPDDHTIALFQWNWTSWIVGELTIDASWAELIQSGNMCQGFSDMTMLDILDGLTVGLRDRDGVLFERCSRDQPRAVVKWWRGDLEGSLQ